jgi:predicted nucleic acid-binding protein
MTPILPDTSVWVEYLRHGRAGWAAEIHEALERDEVLVCGPVVAELVSGVRPDQADEQWRLLSTLPWAPLERESWHEIGSASRRLREAGQTVALVDIAIAIAAKRAGATVWSADEDFDRIATTIDGISVRYQRGQD